MILEPNIPPIDNWQALARAGPVRYFGFFSEQEIQENKGKLLMLDIDFGNKCSLCCPWCFRRHNIVDKDGLNALSYDLLLKILEEAKGLGLQSVKFCGKGEPFEDSRLLRFLIDLNELAISSAIFTKGHVLGDDEWLRSVFRDVQINSSMDVCERLFSLPISILLSFQPLHPIIQDRLYGLKGYTQRRNRALEHLVGAGFNKVSPTRLALACNPLLRSIKDEALEVYKFAIQRNFYPVLAYFMTSGKQFEKGSLLRINDLSDEEKIELHVEIYKWLLENKVKTLEQLKREGISCMPGGHPCNQIAAGLYLTLNGNVTICPGDNRVLGNVRDESISELWEKSENFRRAGTFNCRCPPKDGITIPPRLYGEVLRRLANF